jgi:signal transduction protein with GAF and PtsI domain
MSDEQTSSKRLNSLDERFADDPVMRQRLHQIADLRDRLLAEGASLDEVEEQTVEQIRMLGRELLGSIAQSQADQSAKRVKEENSSAIKHRKKK